MKSAVRRVLQRIRRWVLPSRTGLTDISTLVLDTPTPDLAPVKPAIAAAPVTPLAAPPPRRRDGSLIATAFDSAHPVENRRDLFGRDRELTDLLDAALDQRNHVIIHGARGSGKTSLVRVFGDYADQARTVVLYMPCEPGATFADLMRPFLRHVPSSAMSLRREEFARLAADLPEQFGPRALLEFLLEAGVRDTILVLDEFDRVTSGPVKDDVAAFMKLAADARSGVRLIIVGIAESVTDLVGSHPSMRRHMSIIPVGRIDVAGVRGIIDYGASLARIGFDGDARALVERVACGSPFHVRYFCKCIGIEAVFQGLPEANEPAAIEGLRSGLRAWSRTNEGDHRLFMRIAAMPDMAESLEDLARDAAFSDAINLEDGANDVDDPALRILAPALEQDPRHPARILFKDSVAPQFLIAAVVVNEYSAREVAGTAMGMERPGR